MRCTGYSLTHRVAACSTQVRPPRSCCTHAASGALLAWRMAMLSYPMSAGHSVEVAWFLLRLCNIMEQSDPTQVRHAHVNRYLIEILAKRC